MGLIELIVGKIVDYIGCVSQSVFFGWKCSYTCHREGFHRHAEVHSGKHAIAVERIGYPGRIGAGGGQAVGG